MNDSPKIHLSAFEEQLVTDSGWLLTKNAILGKIKALLLSVQDAQEEVLRLKKMLPAEVMQSSAKITRGENYLGLPWMVLDQPRYFDRENIFAIRTMFWWGNFFSTTLQLSGTYKDLFSPKIIQAYDLLRQNDFHISHKDSPWTHHFEKDNYRRLDEMGKAEFSHFIVAHPFIKLAKKVSLENWEVIDQKLLEDFVILTGLL